MSRRIGVAVGGILTVIAVAFVAVMVVVIRSAPESLPQVTAYSYGRTTTIDPHAYCSVRLQRCRVDTYTASLHVPPGRPLQLSLPRAITDAPWRLIAVYQITRGQIVVEQHLYPRGRAHAVTVASGRFPTAQLGGIEIQIPSAVIDRHSGINYARGIWDLKTN